MAWMCAYGGRVRVRWALHCDTGGYFVFPKLQVTFTVQHDLRKRVLGIMGIACWCGVRHSPFVQTSNQSKRLSGFEHETKPRQRSQRYCG